MEMVRRVLCEGVAGISAMGRGVWGGSRWGVQRRGQLQGCVGGCACPAVPGQGDAAVSFSCSLCVKAPHISFYTWSKLRLQTPYRSQACYGMRTPEMLQQPGYGYKSPELQMLENHFRGNAFTDRERQRRGQWGEGFSALSSLAANRH